MDAVIVTRGLGKTYRADGAEVHAVSGVDLSVVPGELVAVIGPSGCGKSTLLHLLGGLDRATRGEIHLDGHRVDGLSETKWAVLRRRQIGFVFQYFNLIANLTVADNIDLPALLVGTPPAQVRRRRNELLEALGIGERSAQVPSRLSGGEQQRVALARAMINRPAILLADEPTGNLDTQSTRDVLQLLSTYHREGQTTLLVTHDARVASTADRILHMRDGAIVDETRLTDRPEAGSVLAKMIQLEA